MPQILIRNLEDDVVDRLKRRAKASGVSLEELARSALRDLAKPSRDEILAEIDRIRAMSTPSDFDSTCVIREGRDRGWTGD